MTNQEQKDLRKYCSFLQHEYGFDFSPNDPVIPALYVIHREAQSSNQKSEALGKLVEQAAAKINPTTFHFHQPGEAWKFQLGIILRWAIAGLLISLIVWGAAWRYYMAEEVARAKEVLKVSDMLTSLLTETRKDSNGAYYIDFTRFKKLDKKTVRIYLRENANR